MREFIILLVILALVGGILLFTTSKQQTGDHQTSVERTFVTVGTGSMTGVYYQAGNALAKLMEKEKTRTGISITVKSGGGSVLNINEVLSGEIQLGMAQSDRQYQAVHGLAEWKEKGPQKKLRAVCSLHPELVTLIAADDKGIRTITDLKGKTVNIGNPGSGQRGNAQDIFRTLGFDLEKDLKAESLKAAESAKMLQDGRIDAFFYTVGHPAGAIKEAVAGTVRKVRFVPVTGMEKLIEEAPYYVVASIPVKKYYPTAANTEASVKTIGVITTLVTSADVDEELIYQTTKILFTGLDDFKQQHPAFAELTAKNMLKGLSAPLHPGAERYFKEAGLLLQ